MNEFLKAGIIEVFHKEILESTYSLYNKDI